jgi:hypothetical protein
MAYFSGQASSYSELLSVLVSACQTQGWTWSDGILSKGNAFFKIYVSKVDAWLSDEGLAIQGGRGKSGANLLDQTNVIARMGRNFAANTPSFPVKYNLFVFSDPDEIYFYVNHNIDRYIWMSFGQSELVSWYCANFCIAANAGTQSSINSYNPTLLNGGGNNTAGNYYNLLCSGMMFWSGTLSADLKTYNCALYDGGWIYELAAMRTQSPLLGYLPSKFNSVSPLLPIQVFTSKGSNKVAITLELQHARFLRIDNYEPEQVISLGTERWKVYPGTKKDINKRDGENNGGSSTGTFGHAIRYDGP